MIIYFSAPQNTPYQSAFVAQCADKLRAAGFTVHLAADKFLHHQPAFEDAASTEDKALYGHGGKNGILLKSQFARTVFRENYHRLAGAQALVALLDGSQVDDRTACEIGLFYGLMRYDETKKGILGYATDARCLRRRDTTYGVNIFTLGTLEEVGVVLEDFDQVVQTLKTW